MIAESTPIVNAVAAGSSRLPQELIKQNISSLDPLNPTSTVSYTGTRHTESNTIAPPKYGHEVIQKSRSGRPAAPIHREPPSDHIGEL